MATEKIFIIEHCENCSLHQWNTRHNADQYKNHALAVAEAIKMMVPNA